MKQQNEMKVYNNLFDNSIRSSIQIGLNIARDFPQSRAALARVMSHIPGAVKRRNSLLKQGIIVPPLLMVSTTEQCNLRCAGCYAQSRCHETEPEMTRQQIDRLLDQANGAGCSVVLLAGGEPLLCRDWLDAVAARPELLGLVFTNGALLDETHADWFNVKRNMIPLFSIEGNAEMTDKRRGQGVMDSIRRAMLLLSARAVPFGLSITSGEHNVNDVANTAFLRPFRELGCRLVIFTEYVPVDDTEALLALSAESKQILQNFCHTESAREQMLLISFPGDETAFGGCLAAGRGFVHISASGKLEPCPFAAYSDRNVRDVPFMDALASPLLNAIREQSHLLHEGVGGCALRKHGPELQKMLSACHIQSGGFDV